jgi:hypothetical protein
MSVTGNEDNADGQMVIGANHVAVNAVGSAGGEGLGANIWLHYPGDSTNYSRFGGIVTWGDDNNAATICLFGGSRQAVITLDRVQFLFSTGNIATGRMTVWGIAHA